MHTRRAVKTAVQSTTSSPRLLCRHSHSTSSSAVAERPRDASCLSVVSFISTIPRAQSSVISYFRIRFTACTNKFCSLLFSSSWTSMVVVINKDSLMRGGLCGKLHGGHSQLLFALHQSSIDSYPTCIRRPR